MHIHYVEDNLLDIKSVENLVRQSDSMTVTSSQSLMNDTKELAQRSADFILVDINRPDATTLENDVMNLRKHSGAPILFVTGDIADDYRSTAAEAGADGVLEKSSLSVELLQQFFYNAQARLNAKTNRANQRIKVSERDLRCVRVVHQIKKQELHPFYGILGDLVWQLLCEISIANMTDKPTDPETLGKTLDLDTHLIERYASILHTAGLIEMVDQDSEDAAPALLVSAYGRNKIEAIINLNHRVVKEYYS